MATKDKRSLLTETPSRKGSDGTYERFQRNAGISKKELITENLPKPQIICDKSNDFESANTSSNPTDLNNDKESGSSDCCTGLNIDELIYELEHTLEDNDIVQEFRNRLNEAKNPNVSTSEKEKMYRDIHHKFSAYVASLPNKDFTTPKNLTETHQVIKNFITNKESPIKWITHEASMIICTLISVSDNGAAFINLNQLPTLDRVTVMNMTGGNVINKFLAEFDQYKNFKCSATNKDTKQDIHFILGNRVASIPPDEIKVGSDVKVEKKGKEIVIGDTIKLETNRIQNLLQQTNNNNNNNINETTNHGIVSRPKVSGRNAYEIRQDLIENAIDVIRLSDTKDSDYNSMTDNILYVAERLYEFVERKK